MVPKRQSITVVAIITSGPFSLVSIKGSMTCTLQIHVTNRASHATSNLLRDKTWYNRGHYLLESYRWHIITLKKAPTQLIFAPNTRELG